MLLKLILMLALTIASVQGSKVLVLCPMCSKSHKGVLLPLIQALADRNHSITVVSSGPTQTDLPGRVKDIIPFRDFEYFKNLNPVNVRAVGPLGLLDNDMFATTIEGCHKTYQHPPFMALLNEPFDLVVMDAFANQCLLGFISKLKLSGGLIWSMPLPAPRAWAMKLGNHLPPSFVPDIIMPYEQEMTLWERALNLVFPAMLASFQWSAYPLYERIYRGYLGEDLPGIEEMEMDISLMLTNAHFTMNYPRPNLPNVVEVGGIHCRSGRPLPKDLEDFMAGSPDGVVVFSFGTIIKAEHIPNETRDVLIQALGRLKQKVLFKWDDLSLKDLPPNMKLVKWLPLQDVIAHKNTKLFITHGGLLSSQEAIFHKVPMVSIPVWADQDMNTNRYVDMGIAKSLEILSMTADDIVIAVETVLNDPGYKERITKLSDLFRDRPQSAIDLAVYWAEYVIRHKGAPPLRSHGRKLNFFQFHSIDVFAILGATIIIILVTIILVLRKLVQILMSLCSTRVRKEKLQ